LRCGERLEPAANRAGGSVVEERKKLLEHKARFANEALGLEVRSEARKELLRQ
jgi:hypothetical protein